MDYARISINVKNLTITQFEDIGGRGSCPSVSQSAVEKRVKDIHDKCKCSIYVGVAYNLCPIDYYDEGYDHYEVAGARMLKGDRKPRNESWEKTSTPKGWEKRIHIQYNATTRTTKPLTDAFNALGINTSYIKEVQKLLKKNGNAYISPKMINRGYYSEPSSTQFEVSDENNFY